MDVLRLTDSGLYCEAGDFYVDPWRPVERAVVTHAHADHARRGSKRYLTTTPGRHVLQARMGPEAVVETWDYGEQRSIGRAKVSLHPAGHILGSAQVRVEVDGEVWVMAGDYKTAKTDATCAPFEPVSCHTFITESTFGLPIYRWPEQHEIDAEINTWWAANAAKGRASAVFAYALGKSQRVLAGLDVSIGDIYCHGAVQTCNAGYRAVGVPLPETQYAGRKDGEKHKRGDWAGSMIVAPPSALGSTWLRKFGEVATAFASGWMQMRGTRRRKGVERGFVLSDHADWPGLNAAIDATGCERVLITHGSSNVLMRWQREQGREAHALQTFYGEDEDAADEYASDTPPDDAPTDDAPTDETPTNETPPADEPAHDARPNGSPTGG